MSRQQPTGPFCQSGGMPLEKPEDFGTDVTGYRVNDYCHFCFRNGTFTDPQISMQAMIEKCADTMVKTGHHAGGAGENPDDRGDAQVEEMAGDARHGGVVKRNPVPDARAFDPRRCGHGSRRWEPAPVPAPEPERPGTRSGSPTFAI